MIDCQNGEMRDQLPDFVHEQLPAAARVAVAAHVATCAACAAEVALLRELRGAMRAGPKVDVARIVALLPAASRRGDRWAAGRVAQRRRFDWRVAAAIVALAAGGGAAAVLSGGRRGPDVPLPIAGNTSAVQQIATTVSIDADLGEASAVELQALLEDLEDFDGLPAGEPEPPAATPGDAEEGL
jgi:anti-sigma factor RsiW